MSGSPPPALLIFDILNLIMKYIGDDASTKLALGLTCHQLLEPMLDEIWRHLDKAPALLSVAGLEWPIPMRTTKPKIISKLLTSKRHCKSPKQSKYNWTRFDYYAKRIRTFGHPVLERYRTSAMYSELCRARPGVVPLPALQMMQVVDSDCDVNDIPLAETIRTFIMIFNRSTGGDQAAIATLTANIPQLETLVISGIIPPRMQHLDIKFRRLRCLDLRYAISKDDDILRDIMNFVHSIVESGIIQELHLPMAKPSEQSVEQHFNDFMSLETINVTETPAIAAHIFRNLARSPIRHIFVADSDDTLSNSQRETPPYNAADQWRLCFESVLSSFQSLVSIAIYSAVFITPPNFRQNTVELADVIRPLLELRKLREFKIKIRTFGGGYMEPIHENLVSTIGSAWPNLRVLVLDILRPMCFHCFGEFANVCPRLEKLDATVYFDDRTGHSVDTWTTSWGSAAQVERLDLRVLMIQGRENPDLLKEVLDLLSAQFVGILRSLDVAYGSSTPWLRPSWA